MHDKSNSAIIKPGADWYDTRGEIIEAHDISIIKVGSKFYWLGTDRSEMSDTDNLLYQGLNIYESEDFGTWELKVKVLVPTDSGDSDLMPGKKVERPGIIYNEKTKTFVMWSHVCDQTYSYNKAGIAISSEITGPYKYIGSFAPFGTDDFSDNFLYKEGSDAYVMYNNYNPRDNGVVSLAKLTPDYRGIERMVCEKMNGTGTGIETGEGCALFKRQGLYYAVFSSLSGWLPNRNWYQTATSLEGPWSKPQFLTNNISDPEGITFDSQISSVQEIVGTQGTTYVYIGDRWVKGTNKSRYVFLPLEFDPSGKMSLNWYPFWELNVHTGLWKPK